MALRSGAIYAIKIQKKKKSDFLKNNNGHSNNDHSHNNGIGNNNCSINNLPYSLPMNDMKSRDSLVGINYMNSERDKEIIERRNVISLEKRNSPSLIPMNKDFISYYNAPFNSKNGKNNNNDNDNRRNSYPNRYDNPSKDFDNYKLYNEE